MNPSNSYESISGAKRSERKPSISRIPLGFLQLIATRGDEGEVKYGRGNYKKGLLDPQFVEQLFEHALTHLQYVANHYHNHGCFPYREDDDLAGAAWGLMALWEAREAKRLDQELPV